MSIKCGHCQGRHSTVAEVKACSQTVEVPGLGVRVPRTAGEVIRSRQTNAAERAEETRQAAKVPTKVRATEGIYRKAGSIYKVQKAHHGSGYTYAKRLVETGVKDPKTGKSKWRWEMARGFVFELRAEHALSREQAAEFGKLYGVCCACGAILTDEESIAAGIGPICSGKWFS